MMVLCVILAVIFVVAVLPVGVHVCYCENGPSVHAILFGYRVLVYPRKKIGKHKKKEKATKRRRKKKNAEAARDKTPAVPEKIGGTVKAFMPMLRLGCTFLRAFVRKLRVRNLVLQLTYGGEDPAQAAINYGKAQAILHSVMPILCSNCKIRKQDVSVNYDLTRNDVLVYFSSSIIISVGHLVILGAVYGARFLKLFLKMKKGGEKNESSNQ